MLRSVILIVLAALGGILAAQPVITPGASVRNAADYSRRVAPGGYVVVFGVNLASRYEAAPGIPLPVSLLSTSVEVSDGVTTRPIPLLYVSPTQVAGQLFYDLGAGIRVRVVTAEGASPWDALTLADTAPSLYSWDQQGAGRAIITDTAGNLATRQNPVKPGQWMTVYANSLGPVEPPVAAGNAAGDGSPGRPLHVAKAEAGVTIDGRESPVGWAGLTPYFPGLYQINLFTPWFDVMGDLVIRVRMGKEMSTAPMSIPAEPNGFYLVVSGGKFPNSQTKTGRSGPGAAIAFRHRISSIWGMSGFEEWSLYNGLNGPQFAAMSGLALTMKYRGRTVYDNNGIENGSTGGYYDNGDGAIADAEKAGLWEAYSMSNDLFAAFAGYFKLEEPTAIDQIIGYFDSNGNIELPFDPGNVYNRFRVNIFSNGPGDLPGSNSFTGDVLSSDVASGVFEFSATPAFRVSRDGSRDNIFRLVFTLQEPLTLSPGEYWFSHDVAVPRPDAERPEDIGIASALARRTPGVSKPMPPASVFIGQ